MQKLNDKVLVNKKTSKNRILMPPLVCFNWADNDGFETIDRSEHYGARAEGGAGMIVVEATGISPEGRLADTELGLWNDAHKDQFSRIAERCHEHDTLVLVQLVHAGMKSIGDEVYSASDLQVENKSCRSMSIEQIEKVKKDFVEASVRAYEAGLDGVEIHGAHGYLLNQFAASETNRRNDVYGNDLSGRIKLSLDIVKQVRKATSDDFIIGYRLGINDITFKEDIILAKELEKSGVDLLDVSSGIGYGDLTAPKDFELSDITYMGVEIRKHVEIPVASVFGIRKQEQANYLINNDMTDFVAVGRGILADPQWGNKAINSKDINICYQCKSGCKFAIDGRQCPQLLNK